MAKTYRQSMQHTISASQSGLLVKDILTTTLGLSNRSLQKLTRGKGILVNGKKTFLAKPLKEGDHLLINWQESLPSIEPINLELNILYEDQLCVIVNKPAFVPVHPSPGWEGPTLVNGIAYYYQTLGKQFGIHPVARLDTNTTGIVVIAKNSIAHSLLDKVITSSAKTYQAIVHGSLTSSTGTITAPIKSLPHSAKRLIRPDGQQAITHYQVLQVWQEQNLSLLQLKLETGRTHQIRVHLAHIGHPLLGDRLYGHQLPGAPTYKRYALHCCGLTFNHPQTGEVITVTSEFDHQSFLAEKL